MCVSVCEHAAAAGKDLASGCTVVSTSSSQCQFFPEISEKEERQTWGEGEDYIHSPTQRSVLTLISSSPL